MSNFKFELDFEEKLMQNTINKALKKIYPPEVLRKAVEEKKINAQLRKFLVDQGLIGLLNPLKQEDSNLMLSAILVNEAGKRLLSFPLIEHLMALYLLKEEGSSEDVHAYEEGEKIATIGWNEKLQVTAGEKDILLTGVIKSIPFANESSLILVPIAKKEKRMKSQLLIIDTEQVRSQLRHVKTQDATYPLYDLNLDQTMVDGTFLKLIDIDLHGFYRVSDLLFSAELLGIIQETLEMTLDYAKERKQFGIEIGKFQAVKHMLADMYLLSESAKVTLEFGAWSIENDGEDKDIVATISKAYSSDAALNVVESAIQLHGAVGFTWEHDLHFYLKRAHRLCSISKTPYEERQIVAEYMQDQKSVLKNEQNEVIKT